jgi:hypothetical protein
VTARIKHGIEVFLLYCLQTYRLAQLVLCGGIFLKPPCDLRLEVRVVALGIERRSTALRRDAPVRLSNCYRLSVLLVRTEDLVATDLDG